jgi:hypothetical protein
MRWTITTSIDRVAADEWNALCGGDDPFVRHEFLAALERQGCVGERTGWHPHHLLLYEGTSLVGALPMYLKLHSYGEYVFDWAWADAYERCGLAYYPKLVVAVPYTPVTGPRLLSPGDTRASRIRAALIEAAIAFAREVEVSSLHWLFAESEDASALSEQGLLQRVGCQFHWHNEGFVDFTDFLSRLTSKKRKQIKRERRQASELGLRVEARSGDELGDAEWEAFHRFYCSTYDRKWGVPYLTVGFFKEIGRTMPESVLLVLASDGARYVAGSLCVRGGRALYGRNWGCDGHFPALHYEMCYYQTIEYCIRHRLERFEAGAQGEYKVTRGLLPVATRSGHWVRDSRFRSAIESFLARETRGVMHYIREMGEHSPYKAPAPERGAG